MKLFQHKTIRVRKGISSLTLEKLEERRLLSGTAAVTTISETESNNGPLIADSLGSTSSSLPSLAKDLRGSITPNDRDFFRFTLHAPSTVTINLTNLSKDLDLELRNSLQQVIRSSVRSGSSSENISLDLNAGSYYIRVYPYGSATSSYTLQLRTNVHGSDFNDQFSEASTLVSGEINSLTSGDVDIYKFSATAGERISFDLDTTIGTLDSYLRIYDSNGRLIASDDDSPAPGEIASCDSYLQVSFSRAGTYYIAVSSFFNRDYNPQTGGGDRANTDTGIYRIEMKRPTTPPQIETINWGNVSGRMENRHTNETFTVENRVDEYRMTMNNTSGTLGVTISGTAGLAPNVRVTLYRIGSSIPINSIVSNGRNTVSLPLLRRYSGDFIMRVEAISSGPISYAAVGRFFS